MGIEITLSDCSNDVSVSGNPILRCYAEVSGNSAGDAIVYLADSKEDVVKFAKIGDKFYYSSAYSPSCKGNACSNRVLNATFRLSK